MDEHGSSWHCCQGTGKNHQAIFFQQLKRSCTKSPNFHTSTSEGTSWASTASSVPFIFPSEQKKLLVYVLFDGRDQLLSANSLTAARHAAVFNKLLFYRQLQRIREQKGYQSNNKNSDGENIIMNNIRFALNSELVSPHPIKIHYCVLSSEM